MTGGGGGRGVGHAVIHREQGVSITVCVGEGGSRPRCHTQRTGCVYDCVCGGGGGGGE